MAGYVFSPVLLACLGLIVVFGWRGRHTRRRLRNLCGTRGDASDEPGPESGTSPGFLAIRLILMYKTVI